MSAVIRCASSGYHTPGPIRYASVERTLGDSEQRFQLRRPQQPVLFHVILKTANVSRLLSQPQPLLAVLQLTRDARSLNRLPATAQNLLHQFHFFV